MALGYILDTLDGDEEEKSNINSPLIDTQSSTPIGVEQDFAGYIKDKAFTEKTLEIADQDETSEQDFAGYIKDQKQNNIKTIKQNLSLASMNDADQEAEIIRLSEESGLSPEMIRQNMVQVKRMVDLQRLDAEKLSIDSPILAEQLRNPAFAALAYDDLEHLGRWESLASTIAQIPRSAAAGVSDLAGGLVNLAGSGFGALNDLNKWVTGEDTVLLKPLAEALHRLGDSQLDGSEWIQGDISHLPSWAQDMFSGVRSVGLNTPGIVAFLITKNPNFILLPLTGAVAGMSASEALKQGLSETSSLGYGFRQGTIEYITERLPLWKLMKGLKSGDSLIKMLATQFGYENFTEQVATLGQDFDTFLSLPSEKDKTFEDFLNERPEQALHTLIATTTAVALQTPMVYGGNKLAQKYGKGIEVDPQLKEFMENSSKAKQAEDAIKLINELTAEMNEAELEKRSKDAAKNFVKELFQSKISEDESIDDVLIDANDLVEFAQENNIDLSEFPIIQDQLQEAVDTGGFIAIPIEEYMVELSKQEFGPALNELIRLHEDSMSVKEAKVWSEEANQKLIERADRIIDEMADQEQSDKVYQQIVDQLVETGQPREEATKNATLHHSFFVVESKLHNLDMLELFERYGLSVRRVMDDVQFQNPEQLGQLADLILAPQVTETVEATQKATYTEQEAREVNDIYKNSQYEDNQQKILKSNNDSVEYTDDNSDSRMWNDADLIEFYLKKQLGLYIDTDISGYNSRYIDVYRNIDDFEDGSSNHIKIRFGTHDTPSSHMGKFGHESNDYDVRNSSQIEDALNGVYKAFDIDKGRQITFVKNEINSTKLDNEKPTDKIIAQNNLGISQEQLTTIRSFLEESGLDLTTATQEEIIPVLQKALYSPEGNVLNQSKNNAIQEDEKWRNHKPKLDKNGKPVGSPEWVKNTKDLTKLRKHLRQLLKEGESGRYWYENSARGVMRIVKGDVVEAEKFIQLLAIYSAHTEVFVNTGSAIKAYTQWKNGVSEEDFHVATKDMDKKATNLLYHSKNWPGRKTGTFYKNLMYEIVRTNPDALDQLHLDDELDETINKGATIDVWMYRAFGYIKESGGDDKGLGKYSFSENETRRLTARLNKDLKPNEERWTPHQVQAAVWASMRTRYNFSDVKAETNKKSLKRKLSKIVFKDGKKKVVAPVKGENKDKHYAIWRKEAMKVESERVTKEAEGNDASFAVQLNKMTKNVTWEAVPSPELNHDILNATPETQQKFTQLARNIIVDENGNDSLGELLGVPLNWDSLSHGAYKGVVSPNVVSRLIPPKSNGVFPREDVRLYAQSIQYIFKQNAVPWFRADPRALITKTAEEEQKFRVYKVSTGRTISGGVVDTLKQAKDLIKKAVKEDETIKLDIKGGKYATGITVRFKNDLTLQDVEKVIQLTKIGNLTQTDTNELTIVNFRDDNTGIPFVDDEVFLVDTFNVLDKHFKSLNMDRQFRIYTEGEYGQDYEDNWKGDPQGKKLLTGGSLSGRSDLHSWIRDRRSEFENLLEEYSGENLKLREEELALERTFYQDKRGSIQFSANIGFRSTQTIISLFENSDRSTFLHESGHFFLQVLQDLAEDTNPPKAVAEDWKIILKYLGVEKGSDIGVEEHEKWARGFEKYLFEGKAPSIGLQDAFSRFKLWLKSVYTQGVNLNVEINDDIRGVFDRMLATKEEIEAAKEAAGHIPLFKTAAVAGMTDAEFRHYQKVGERATREAEVELDRKKLLETVLFNQPEFKEEQKKVRLEAEEEVNGMPVYQVIHFLQTGEMLDGSPAVIPHMKLNTKLLKKEFGPDILGQLRKGKYAIHEKDGVHHDEIAVWFGFSSGKQMVDAIRKAKTRKDYINELTTDRMEDKWGALHKDEQRVRQEGIKANYMGRERARLLGIEMKFLSKRSGNNPEANAAEQVAKEIIAKRLVTNFQIGRFRLAEQSAAKKAESALLKQNFAEAQKQKGLQLLNHHLYRQAVLAQAKVEKIQKHIDRLKKPGTRKNIRQDELDRIDQVFELYDFKKSVSQKAIEKRKTFAAWLQKQKDIGNQVVITPKMQKAIENATKKHYKEMTFEELQELDDYVTNLEHIGRRHQKLLSAKNARETEELIRDMLHTTLRDLGPAERDEALKDITEKGWWGETVEATENIATAHDKMEFLFEFMDGFKDNGVWWQNTYKRIADGANKELEMQEYYIARLDAIFKKHFTKAERRAWSEKVDTELDIILDKTNIISMALNTGNQYNRESMYEGFENDREFKINRQDVDKLLWDNMQAKDWQAVQEIWDLINELWPEVAEQEKLLTGVVPKKVESHQVVTKFGVLRGGYYPIVFDPTRGQLAKDRGDKADTEDLMETTWRFPITRHAHTKERTNSAKQFIELNMNIISRHIMTVIHDVSFRIPVMEINRLMKKDEIRNIIVDHAGQSGYSQIKPWLQGIANDTIEDDKGIDKFLRRARHSSSIVSMGMKFSTALMQPFGYSQSWYYLGTRWATNGLRYYSKNPRRAQREAFSKSTFMRNRQKTFDRDVRDVLRRLTGQDTKLKEIQQQQFILIAVFDMAVSLPTWHGGYAKAISEGMNEDDAIAMGDMAVRKSQGSGGPQDLAAIQRGSEKMKMWGQFYSYFNTLWQANKRNVRMRKYNKISSFQAATNFLLTVTLPAIGTALLMDQGPDDDEEFWWWALKQQPLYVASSIIGVRDLASFVDYPMFGIEPPAADLAKSIYQLAVRGIELVADEDAREFDLQKDVSKGIVAFAYMFKLPGREADNMWKHFTDVIDGEDFNLWEFFVKNNKKD